MSDFQKHKKSDKIKWVVTMISFVIVFILIVGVCMQLFAANEKLKPSNWFKKTETEQTTPLPDKDNENQPPEDETPVGGETGYVYLFGESVNG